MVNCSVPGCNSRSREKNDITYHRYPASKILQEKWINATGLPKSKLPLHDERVCSRHFPANCFTKVNNVTVLAQDSVPTLNLCTEQTQTSKIDYVDLNKRKTPRRFISSNRIVKQEKICVNKRILSKTADDSLEKCKSNQKASINPGSKHVLKVVEMSKLLASKPNRTVFKVISDGKLETSSDKSFKGPTGVSKAGPDCTKRHKEIEKNSHEMSSNSLEIIETIEEASIKRNFNLIEDNLNISANVHNDFLEDTMQSGDNIECEIETIDTNHGISSNSLVSNNPKHITHEKALKNADKLPPETRKFIFWLQKKAAVAESQKKTIQRLRSQVNRLQKKNKELTAAIEIMKAESLNKHNGPSILLVG